MENYGVFVSVLLYKLIAKLILVVNKMTSCFAVVNYEKKISINKAAFTKNKNQSSKND